MRTFFLCVPSSAQTKLFVRQLYGMRMRLKIESMKEMSIFIFIDVFMLQWMRECSAMNDDVCTEQIHSHVQLAYNKTPQASAFRNARSALSLWCRNSTIRSYQFVFYYMFIQRRTIATFVRTKNTYRQILLRIMRETYSKIPHVRDIFHTFSVIYRSIFGLSHLFFCTHPRVHDAEPTHSPVWIMCAIDAWS